MQQLVFIPLTKVDYEKRQVWGWGTVEQPDRSGEIMDWQSSRPYFERWSSLSKERSGGKSLGNLRGQHNDKIAAGRLIALELDDERKGAWVGAEVVDNNEWEKVIKGVYTGFSIGGKYANRWPDALSGLWRYTADPSELSLVDAPCVPGATFQMVKADGVETVLHKAGTEGLKTLLDTPTPDDPPAEIAIPSANPAAGVPAAVQVAERTPDPFPVGNKPESIPPTPKVLTHHRESAPLTAVASAVSEKSERTKGVLTMSKVKVVAPIEPSALAKRGKVFARALQKGLQAGEVSPYILSDALPVLKSLAAYLAKEDVKDTAEAAQKLVEAAKEQAAKGEIDAGLLNNVANTLGTMVEMVEELESEVEDEDGFEDANDPEAEDESDELAADAEDIAEAVEDAVEEVSEKAWTEDELQKKRAKKPSGRSADARAGMFASMRDQGVYDPRKTADPVKAGANSSGKKRKPKKGVYRPRSERVASMERSEGAPPMTKGNQPMPTTPPAAVPISAYLQPGAAIEKVLPDFVQALTVRDLKKAHALVGGSQEAFDQAVSMAGHKVLTEMGLTWNNRNRIPAASTSNPDDLAKAITAGDAPGINLIPLVQLMLPVYSGIGSRIPMRQPRTGSNQATWRSLIGFSNEGANAASTMSVAEASTGTAMIESFQTYNAAYRDATVNDKVTLKSTFTMRGYDDPLQIAIMNSLAFMLGVRERNLLYSNVAALGAPTGVAGTPSATGGTLAASSGSHYTVKVTALSGRGFTNGDKGGVSTVGETDAGAATGIVTTGSTSSIAVTWTPVRGAVAYNVYISSGSGSAVRWVATTGRTAFTITAYPGSGNDAPATDTTANANGYNGLFSWAQLTSVYGVSTPTPKSFVNVAGGALTATQGGITQINQVLSELWSNWKIAPTLAVMSPATRYAITSKLLGLNNAATYRIDISAERGGFTGGMFVGALTNPFASEAGGGIPRTIDLQANPYMPDGTILILSETAPYGTARNSRVFEVEQLIPFTYFPLAQTTLEYPFALTASEVPLCYHPSAQAAVVGFDVNA